MAGVPVSRSSFLVTRSYSPARISHQGRNSVAGSRMPKPSPCGRESLSARITWSDSDPGRPALEFSMPRIFSSLFRSRATAVAVEPPQRQVAAQPDALSSALTGVAKRAPDRAPDLHFDRVKPPRLDVPMITLGQLDRFQQDALLSNSDKTAWIESYGVNPKTLICVDGKCTRYGLLEFGEHRFIVGPAATPTEGVALTRMLKAHPEIGAIFCVEPGAMQKAGETNRYLPRPAARYLARVAALGGDTPQSRLAVRSAADVSKFEGSLAHVKFMEFSGMEHGGAAISGATLWKAGQGVADFLRQHPGKIALVCSEQGISRPCAVIASALLQLQQQPADGEPLTLDAIVDQVETQRARQSAYHIGRAHVSFGQIAECAELINTLRSPDGWCMAANRILPRAIDRLRDFDGLHVSVIARCDPPEGYRGPVMPPATLGSNELAVFVSNGLYFPTYDQHMPTAMRPSDPTELLSALYRCLQRMSESDARGRTPPINLSAEAQCIARWRHQMANYLEADFDRTVSLLASTTLPPKTELIWLPGQTDFFTGFQRTSEHYLGPHTDRISLEDIDPASPDAVRLITRTDDATLMCDNKYYAASSVEQWHQQCQRSRKPMSHPTSRAPVVALLVGEGHAARIGALLHELAV
ncbi:hypothetical protein [Pandoraea sp. PE-S2R-1]|uniref:hypothetical protein n=1 Tax=Pandoraea sp. PE-S2R-1 TaxID=1986994 RepID=UPI001131F225|nr:hypothetical protein [Pandoraea sp. PE-S2R-1]